MSRKHRLAGLHKRMELLVSRIKADDAELTKLRNEQAKHRKEEREDIADVLGVLRKWINSKDD